MAHIQLPEGLPGISGLLAYRAETAKPLRQLAQVLLQDHNGLTPGERELIAASVSFQNGCQFCQASHSAAAASHLGNKEIVDQVKKHPESAPISAKLRALLVIAGQVRLGGKNVTEEAVAGARQEGATDLEIHDTVLIAAAFCMYNRYVDGLATIQPEDENLYSAMGKQLAQAGYL